MHKQSQNWPGVQYHLNVGSGAGILYYFPYSKNISMHIQQLLIADPCTGKVTFFFSTALSTTHWAYKNTKCRSWNWKNHIVFCTLKTTHPTTPFCRSWYCKTHTVHILTSLQHTQLLIKADPGIGKLTLLSLLSIHYIQ